MGESEAVCLAQDITECSRHRRFVEVKHSEIFEELPPGGAWIFPRPAMLGYTAALKLPYGLGQSMCGLDLADSFSDCADDFPGEPT